MKSGLGLSSAAMRKIVYASCWWLHLAILSKFQQNVDIKQCQDLLPNDWRKELLSVEEALAKEVLVDLGKPKNIEDVSIY